MELLQHFQAEERIEHGRFDPENGEQTYILFMLAYNNPELAENERLRSQQRMIDRTCPTSTRG